jgi:hypothetical protein
MGVLSLGEMSHSFPCKKRIRSEKTFQKMALLMASLYVSFFCQLSTETKQMHNSTRENNKKKCPTDLLRELETDIDRKRHDLELAEFSMKVSKYIQPFVWVFVDLIYLL